MRDDPILALERELVSAARRRQAPAPGPARARPRASAGALALAGSVIVVFVVAAVALVALHGHTGTATTPQAPAQRVGGPAAELRGILAVLRRPQTAADRRALDASHVLQAGRVGLDAGSIDPASARLATITPWGVHVLLILVDSVKRRSDGRSAPPPLTGLLVSTGNGTGCCASAAGIALTGDVSYETDGGPSALSRVYAVVPDGVATVGFHVPQGPRHRPVVVRAPVHGNVAAVQIRHHPCCTGWSPLMTWYASDGRVIKHVGHVGVSGSVAAPPPTIGGSAVPEAVTVRPRVGSPHGAFTALFRVPRTGADYYYQLAGPAGCAFSSSGVTIGHDRADARGREFRIPLAPAAGRLWCVGTWGVDIGLMKANRKGSVVPSPPAFGRATFTVRRRTAR